MHLSFTLNFLNVIYVKSNTSATKRWLSFVEIYYMILLMLEYNYIWILCLFKLYFYFYIFNQLFEFKTFVKLPLNCSCGQDFTYLICLRWIGKGYFKDKWANGVRYLKESPIVVGPVSKLA